MNLYTFIGGPCDGERRQVPDEDGMPVAYVTALKAEYRRAPLMVGAKAPLFIYVHCPLTTEQAIRQMLERYSS